MIVLETCPGEETICRAYFDCQIKTIPASQSFHGTDRQLKKKCQISGKRAFGDLFLYPLMAGRLLVFMAIMIARLMVFKATADLESKGCN